MMTCENCKHSKLRKTGDGILQLFCVRELPHCQAQLIPTQNGPAWTQTTFWPMVDKQDTCSKHEVQLQ